MQHNDPSRAQTWTAPSGVEHTNHKGTGPPNSIAIASRYISLIVESLLYQMLCSDREEGGRKSLTLHHKANWANCWSWSTIQGCMFCSFIRMSNDYFWHLYVWNPKPLTKMTWAYDLSKIIIWEVHWLYDYINTYMYNHHIMGWCLKPLILICTCTMYCR